MASGAPLPQPDAFLIARIRRDDLDPTVCGLCVGYELKEWRAKQLADHIVEWIPEFALTYSECQMLGAGNSIRLIRRAAQTVYTSQKFKNRGEFGELLLHAAVRQVYNSIPAISKIYYKSANNETVKGFDAVHVVGPPDDMELWLGEAKFYKDIKRAISEVVKELHDHLDRDYLRSEFNLIAGKIDSSLPHSEVLKKLLSPSTSLDEVFNRVCIPVLLTYDSECLAGHSSCTAQYKADLEKEVLAHHSDFLDALNTKKGLPKEVRIHLFLLPLHTKQKLIAAFDERLKAWQKL